MNQKIDSRIGSAATRESRWDSLLDNHKAVAIVLIRESCASGTIPIVVVTIRLTMGIDRTTCFVELGKDVF